MTEEINNLNTDLKELFVNYKFEEITKILNTIDDNIVIEITSSNYDIIQNYYKEEKYTILVQFIKFVAYSSFLCEYSVNRKLISNDEYNDMLFIFEKISELQQNNN